jgi:hypothetical protein
MDSSLFCYLFIKLKIKYPKLKTTGIAYGSQNLGVGLD